MVTDGESPANLRLHRVEVENFKSYKGNHSIGPFERLTAVIGPNGSGKSNLMDAISFALGVQSRHMRSHNLSSLVYRPARADAAAPNSAFVALHFVWPSGATKEFKRSIVLRESSCSSHYFLDGQPLTADDFVEELRKVNIVVKARNFLVFQGDVVDVARRSPAELGKLFEQISGSDLLVGDYERHESELASASADLKLKLVKRHAICSELQRIETEVEAARRHAASKEQWKIAQSKLLCAKLYQNEQSATQARQQFEESAAAESEAVSARTAAQEQLREADARLVQAEAEIRRIEVELERAANGFRAMETSERSLNEQVRSETKRRLELQGREQSEKVQREKLQRVVESKEKSLEDLRNKLLSLEASASDPPAAARTFPASVVAQYRQLRETAAIQTSRIDSKLALARYDLQNAEKKAKTAAELAANAAVRLEAVQTAARTAGEESREIAREKTELEGAVATAAGALEAAKSRCEDQSNERGLLQNEKAQLESKINFLQSNYHENQAERIRRESVERLQVSIPGIHGTLNSLYRLSIRRYRLAVSVALGRMGDDIVVDTFETGKQAVSLLKQLKLPPLNFIPLDNVSKMRIPPKIREIEDAKLALDCMDFDRKFTPAFTAALNTTVIVEDLKVAERVAYVDAPRKGLNIRAVTISGDRILKNGNFAVETKMRTNYGSDLREISDLQQEIGKIIEKLDAIDDGRKALLQCEEQHRALERKLQDCCSRQRLQLSRCEQCERQLKDSTAAVVENSKMLEKAQKHQAFAEAEVLQLETELQSVLSSVYAPLGVDVNELREQEEAEVRAKRKCDQEIKTMKIAVSRAESELDALKAQEERLRNPSLAAELLKCERFLKTSETRLTEAREKIEKSRSEMSAQRTQILAAQQEQKSAREAAKEKEKRIKELSAGLTSIVERRSSAADKLESLTAAAIEILRYALLNSIDIPLRKGSMATFSRWCGLQDETTSSDEQQEEEEPEIDWSAALTEDELACFDSPVAVTEVLRRKEATVAALHEEVKNTPANLHALVKERELRAELSSVEEDLRCAEESKKKVEKEFQAVRKERLRRFLACFHHAKEAVEETYAHLTGGSGSLESGKENNSFDEDLGTHGEAFLELQEQPSMSGGGHINTAIQFNVMPPSKRYSDMRRLSGGEKTIAALALLFALQSYNAAPFFVLDEIDAALDPANVVALAEYLRNVAYQVILISHSDRLFSQADRLVGVYVNAAAESSEILTLALRNYFPV